MRSDRFTYPGIGVAVGGLFGALGVFADWFSYTATVAGGQLTVGIAGTEDWSGRLAVVAGFSALLFGGAYILLSEPTLRKVSGAAMAASSAVLLVMTLWGAIRVDDVVPDVVARGALGDVAFTGSISAGLAVSFVGGVLAFVASFMAIRQPAADTAEDAVAVPADAVVEAG
ncbi:MAG: hypothetical protein U0V56_06975 [Actinomycetota bacterium]